MCRTCWKASRLKTADGPVVNFVIFIVLVALAFDFINGFHDSANSIATIVGTRVLSPLAAVIWAAVFNFSALFFVGTAVAKSVAHSSSSSSSRVLQRPSNRLRAPCRARTSSHWLR